jgi:hypothetical protein
MGHYSQAFLLLKSMGNGVVEKLLGASSCFSSKRSPMAVTQ